MGTRSTAHAKDEKAIFDAILATHPAFGADIGEFSQSDEEFPDVVAVMRDSVEIDFELAEWLDGAQMADAKRYDRLAEAILDPIGWQAPNSSRHFRAVMICPRTDPPAFNVEDKADFKAAVTALIEETDRRWSFERFWHSPQGRICRELAALAPRSSWVPTPWLFRSPSTGAPVR